MADPESTVGNDQTVVSDGIVVGDMSTVGGTPTVTSKLFHVPSDKVVILVVLSGNELSFVARPEINTVTQKLMELASGFAAD